MLRTDSQYIPFDRKMNNDQHRTITFSQKNIDKWNARLEKITNKQVKLKTDKLTSSTKSADNKTKANNAKMDHYNYSALNQAACVFDELSSKTQTKITEYEKEATKLQADIDEATVFLRELKDSPSNLFTQLSDAIRELDRYEGEFDQDDRSRLCLYRLSDKLNAIMSYNTVKHEEDEKLWQMRYALLCGFIWDLRFQFLFKNNYPDSRLLKALNDLVFMTHVEGQSDLPEECSVGRTCYELFESVKNSNIQLFHLPLEEFHEEENKNYVSAMNDANSPEAKLYPLSAEIRRLSKAIAQEIKQQERAWRLHPAEIKRPEYSLYTRILKQGLDLSMIPISRKDDEHDDHRLENFAALINRVTGKPRPNRKIIGAMLAIFGAAICAASVTVAIMTAGISAPVSVMGITMGLSLILKGTAVASVATGLIGLGLFKTGCERGVLKEMNRMHHAISKCR